MATKRWYSIYLVWERYIDKDGCYAWEELPKPRYIAKVQAHGIWESMEKVSKRTGIHTGCMFPKVGSVVTHISSFPPKKKRA